MHKREMILLVAVLFFSIVLPCKRDSSQPRKAFHGVRKFEKDHTITLEGCAQILLDTTTSQSLFDPIFLIQKLLKMLKF